MLLKVFKIIVFGVGSYYIIQFLVRLYHARKKMNQQHHNKPVIKQDPNPQKKNIVNPNAGEYTDYEELKD